MRICSFLPSATEMVCALGATEELVGITHECDYPPEIRSRRIVVRSRLDPALDEARRIDQAVREQLAAGHSLYLVDTDALREADPDVILTQELCAVCAASQTETRAAVAQLPRPPQVVSLSPRTLTDVLRSIRQVGDVLGRRPAADALVQRSEARLSAIWALTNPLHPKPRVAMLEWLDPLWIGGHWVPDMVAVAGGEDALGTSGAPSRTITWEALAASRPEVIVLSPCGYDASRALREAAVLRAHPVWRTLPAVQHGRVYAVDANAYVSRPGPRLVDGVELLAHLAHPTRVPWTRGLASTAPAWVAVPA